MGRTKYAYSLNLGLEARTRRCRIAAPVIADRKACTTSCAYKVFGTRPRIAARSAKTARTATGV